MAMDIYSGLQTVGGILIAALVYSYLFFKKKSTNGEEFDPAKMKRTMGIALLTGLCVAIGSWYWGVDQDATVVLLTVNTGGFWTVMIDKAVSWIQAKYFS